MFLEGFPDRYVRPGSDVSLACHVTGSPPPEVVWTLDDRDLPRDDPRFNVGHSVTDSGNSRLTSHQLKAHPLQSLHFETGLQRKESLSDNC